MLVCWLVVVAGASGVSYSINNVLSLFLLLLLLAVDVFCVAAAAALAVVCCCRYSLLSRYMLGLLLLLNMGL